MIKIQNGDLSIEVDSSREAIELIRSLNRKEPVRSAVLPKEVKKRKKGWSKISWTKEALKDLYFNLGLSPRELRRIPSLSNRTKSSLTNMKWVLCHLEDRNTQGRISEENRQSILRLRTGGQTLAATPNPYSSMHH
jgi:hypothetical protein